ncbi:RGS domain-containing protein [Absidia repens]|uniref:RGS domain-containing protein n=1 Tax=Absidia repens TaxID=90262 RepID=A0A1X2IMC6_9FUNG|nr:RGS domain-containing protein [Absidia repens]
MEDEETTNPLDHDYDHDYLQQQQYDQNFSSFSPPIGPTSTQTSSTISASRPRSNSISSSISESLKKLTQYNNLPNFDIHTMYKIKKRRSSSGNVDQQHQNQAQIQKDICIQDIKNDGIGAMLNSRVPLCYFLHHLLEEYSCENLFFYLELQQYERINYVSVAQQLAAAEHIHDTYLARNCQFEVNLDDKVRSSVTSALEARNADHCFQTAKREVYLLLESSFMQFMRTDIWNQMIENCGKRK